MSVELGNHTGKPSYNPTKEQKDYIIQLKSKRTIAKPIEAKPTELSPALPPEEPLPEPSPTVTPQQSDAQLYPKVHSLSTVTTHSTPTQERQDTPSDDTALNLAISQFYND